MTHLHQHESKAWRGKKASFDRELRSLDERSPIFHLLDSQDLGPEYRAMISINICTLIKPRDEQVMVGGPVLVGLRYRQDFLCQPPCPWDIASILSPLDFYHPNQNFGGLCLGAPCAGISLEAVAHIVYAAVSFVSVNCVEWQGLCPEAAAYVRSKADYFPILTTGILEEPDIDPRFWRPKGDFTPFVCALPPRAGRGKP